MKPTEILDRINWVNIKIRLYFLQVLGHPIWKKNQCKLVRKFTFYLWFQSPFVLYQSQNPSPSNQTNIHSSKFMISHSVKDRIVTFIQQSMKRNFCNFQYITDFRIQDNCWHDLSIRSKKLRHLFTHFKIKLKTMKIIRKSLFVILSMKEQNRTVRNNCTRKQSSEYLD